MPIAILYRKTLIYGHCDALYRVVCTTVHMRIVLVLINAVRIIVLTINVQFYLNLIIHCDVYLDIFLIWFVSIHNQAKKMLLEQRW